MSPSRAGSDSGRELQPFPQLALTVADASRVGEARRSAVALAEEVGLDETERGKLAIAVTELATNVVRHAREGVILLRPLLDGESGGQGGGVEVLALDRGPGIANLPRALEDGFSTAGTAGNGIGAVRRLASRCDFFSHTGAPGAGTVVLARFALRPGRPSPPQPGPPPLEYGVVCVPAEGERRSGDAWAALPQNGRTRFLVVDGLGHGPAAAEAAEAAVSVFRDHPDATPVDLLQLMHGALRSTRGAAAAIADVTPGNGRPGGVRFAGVGNVAASVVSGEGSRHMVSMNGTLGHQLHKVQEFAYEWPAGALLVMYSDGLSSRWRLDQYPGVSRRHPSVAAALLFRDAKRGRDDVTVLVAREPEREERP